MAKTILLVDDDLDILESEIFFFKRADFTVLTADNAKDAFEILTSGKHKVDVVLTDIKMPEIDGVTLLMDIKNKFPEIPVIFLITGFSTYTREDVIEKGAIDVFSKPIDMRIVIERIDKTLESN